MQEGRLQTAYRDLCLPKTTQKYLLRWNKKLIKSTCCREVLHLV